MLFNKGDEITVKYNGIEKTVKKGARIDVRDFDVSIGQTQSIKEIVPKVEKFFLKKYPGRFEVVETVDDQRIEDEYRGQIDTLKKKIDELEKDLEAERKMSHQSAKKVSEMAEEINGFGAKESGYKNEIKRLKATIDEMEDEHKAHIKRMTGGK